MNSVDVLILGGGVNGVAALREFSLNGVSCLLVERGDFSGGASGVSTRMAHGGLRYLENREFALVRESVRERNLLLKNAPHMTAEQALVLPLENIARGFWGSVFNYLGFGARRVAPNYFSIKSALMLYEYFGHVNRILPRHSSRLGRQGLPENIRSSFRAYATYYDGKIINPEGIIFEMLEEAVMASSDAAALNHVDFKLGAEGSVTITDQVSGESYSVSSKIIVNATGAWLDKTNAILGVGSDYVSAVKGAQIIVRHDELRRRIGDTAFYYSDHEGRLVICNPLPRTILMGTTEVVLEDVAELSIEPGEVDYLMRSLSSLFDDIDVRDEHIVAAITGARPLQKTAEGDAYSAKRDHVVHHDDLPDGCLVLSLAGGKWTTFRAFAEELADIAFTRLGKKRQVSTRERTYRGTPVADTPLPDQTDHRACHLFERYGAVWSEISEFCNRGKDRFLLNAPDYTEREIVWLVEYRGAVYLDDIILRRTQIALDGLATDGALHEIARIMAATRGETDEWVTEEVARCSSMNAIRYIRKDLKRHGDTRNVA